MSVTRWSQWHRVTPETTDSGKPPVYPHPDSMVEYITATAHKSCVFRNIVWGGPNMNEEILLYRFALPPYKVDVVRYFGQPSFSGLTRPNIVLPEVFGRYSLTYTMRDDIIVCDSFKLTQMPDI